MDITHLYLLQHIGKMGNILFYGVTNDISLLFKGAEFGL